MPEGRVRNTGSALKAEYLITDQQGNVRVSVEDDGNNFPQVRQENSYYPFGLVMIGSPVPQPTQANKNLYNSGSEWQNDFGDLPDLYRTFYRDYDAALGRFTGVDPEADQYDHLSPYQYAGNNPVLYNDPMGNRLYAPSETQGVPMHGFGDEDSRNRLYANSLDGGGGTFGSDYDPSLYDIWTAVNLYGTTYNDNNSTDADWRQKVVYAMNGLSQLTTAADGSYKLTYEAYSLEKDEANALYTVNTGYIFDKISGSIRIGADQGIYYANQGGCCGVPDHANGVGDTPGMKVHYTNSGNNWSYPGVGIFVNQNQPNRIAVIQHEYGHYLQFLKHGSDYTYYDRVIAIPSAWNLLWGASNYEHDRMDIELEATTLAHDFYGKYSLMNNYQFPTFYTNPPKK